MSKFKPGDKVKCMRAWHDQEVEGAVYTVAAPKPEASPGYIRLVEHLGVLPDHNYDAARYCLVEEAPAVVVPAPGEYDPTGKSQHQPGAKLDAGKLRPSLVLGGFAHALKAVVKVGTDGANKYTDNGWREVPNGFARYSDAKVRHALAFDTGETHDKDTGSLHLAHEAWNALARLELYLQANPEERV